MASFQLFHEQGFHATGIATILRETDLNPGSLYHFFPSKDALLIGVLEFALVLLRPAVMDPAEKRSDDPIERMFELLQQYPEGMHAWGCKMGCPIGNLALEVSDDNHAARALIHQNFENWTTAVKKWLDDADFRVGGLIRTVYDPKAQLGDPATIINEIMVFEPEHMLAMRIHKPSAGLPYPQAWQSMWVGDHVHRPRRRQHVAAPRRQRLRREPPVAAPARVLRVGECRRIAPGRGYCWEFYSKIALPALKRASSSAVRTARGSPA